MAVLAAPSLRTRSRGRRTLDAALFAGDGAIAYPQRVIRDYLGRIEAAAGGRIKTQLFESGQLFPDLQVGKALLQGQIEMAVPGAFALTGVVPDADFFQLPVLYGRTDRNDPPRRRWQPGKAAGAADRAAAQFARDRSVARSRILQLVQHQQAADSYGDLKGMKIRNSGGAGQAWRTQFMGAIPNTTPLPNVSLGLSQGTFDGLITTIETISSGQFWESGIRHGFEDHQFFAEYIPLVSLAFWQKLSPDLQQVFTDHLAGQHFGLSRQHGGRAGARPRRLAGARDQDRGAVGRTSLPRSAQEMMAKQELGRETLEDFARKCWRRFRPCSPPAERDRRNVRKAR